MRIKNLKIYSGFVACSLISGAVVSAIPTKSEKIVVLKPEYTTVEYWNEDIEMNKFQWNVVNNGSLIKVTWIPEDPVHSYTSIMDCYKTKNEELKYNIFGHCLNADVTEGNEYLTIKEYEEKVEETKELKKKYPRLFASEE